jgi:hypothetical protein
MNEAMVLISGAVILTVAGLRLLPVLPAANALLAVTRRSASVLKYGPVSDHWKQRAAALLARSLFGASARFGLWLVVAILPLGAALVLAIDRGASLTNWSFRGALVLTAFLTNMAINAVNRHTL